MPLSAQDRCDIADLYARYRHAADTHNGQDYAALFTEDGEFTPGLGPFVGQTFRGREALARMTISLRGPATVHWSQDPVLDGRGDHVHGWCYGMVVDLSSSPAAIRGHSMYHDVLVKVDGRWLFKSRRSRGASESKPATAVVGPSSRIDAED